MNKKLLLPLLLSLSVSGGAYATIYGTSGACAGSSSVLHSTTDTLTPAGTWSSANPSVATVASSIPSTATVTGVAPGTATIIYTGPSGTFSTVFTVSPTPAAITGPTTPICPGIIVTYTCATSGGVWSSISTAIATIGSATGIATSVSPGAGNILYTISSGCSSSIPIVVSGPDSVVGVSTVCLGGTATYTCTAGAGTWSSSNPSVATVSSSGVVTGVSAGTATITCSVPGACGTPTKVITVGGATVPGTISGPSSVAVGSNISLSASVMGGTWTSSATGIATVSSTGVVTGVAGGTATISYAVTGCGGVAYATYVVTVTADCISGNVLFGGPAVGGDAKVWLIKYNPTTHMLYAVDSQVTSIASGTAHYSFCGMGTDSFRIKAAYNDSMFVTVGYQPTYHTASAYWSTANVVNHVSTTMDINKDINMGYGTVPSGPGFIAGDVTTGANKGTADGAPAPNILVYCVNISTGAILQQTLTNSAGHYSFTGLPSDVPLRIYPEVINYATTPYPAITLTAAAPSMSAASFIQHTLSYTITPITAGVNDITGISASVKVFPNPASGTFHIEWSNLEEAGVATVVLTDVTGRQVMTSSVDMSSTAGQAPVNVADLSSGLYMLHIRANGLNVNTKIELQ